MKGTLRILVTTGGLLALTAVSGAAFAQQSGGTLRIGHFDSPASMSMLEESTVAANRPMMGVFNNLVMFKQDVPQNSPQSIVPDLATGWSWSEDGTELTLPLRHGVKWHDGKPFTAADVKCTFDAAAGQGAPRNCASTRANRGSTNLAEVTTKGDYEVTFHLKRPQPSFLALLATGWTPIYPCHVPPAADAPAPDRHRPVQVRRVQAQRDHQGRRATRITGSRGGLISTASNTRSSRTSRPGSWPSWPARPTSISASRCRS